ncbi:hypothetical protein [Hirschia litorea]|uniref:Uncharacterized protein n=1 Tax=Hirschia litorea TaxID=1199156 RepID=A0ABW2IQ90_9PROT
MNNPPITNDNVKNFNRLEIIDENGRAYVNIDVKEIDFSVQDDGKTLKFFVRSTPLLQEE